MTNLIIKLFIKSNDVNNHAVRLRYGLVSGVVGIVCNILLFISKFTAGLLTASIAITADALNNLSDAGSSIVTLVGFKLADTPADVEHPFGHGRLEYVSGLIVSMIIMLMGVEIFKSSVGKIITPEQIEFSILPLIIMIASIGVKLWMCLFNRSISKKINSTALAATAMDSLSDVAATSAVVIGILVNKFTGINIDGYMGCVVALFILYTGFTAARDTLNPLLGQPPEPEFVNNIKSKVLSYNGVVGIHDLIVHNYGPSKSLVSLHAEVPCDIDILKIHDTIDNIERELKQEFNCEAVIHMDPIITNDETTNLLHFKICDIVKTIDSAITVHDFRMVSGPSHTNLIFDIVVPIKFTMEDTEVIQLIQKSVTDLDETYYVVVNVDKAFLI